MKWKWEPKGKGKGTGCEVYASSKKKKKHGKKGKNSVLKFKRGCRSPLYAGKRAKLVG